ncbi:MAG: hypothetical protein CVV47_01130 [Spirochaetae bacterium HGW-Spirochaetae-3]|jgi:hypothetical protein|nr:MAG: hypothetical protein CVV47_01130 [Spirochaetae bacterium HGW-Spirochaetae-3]
MRSFPLTVFVAALAIGAPAMAQDEAALPGDEAPAIALTGYTAFERGDGILSLSLGVAIPLGFYNPGEAVFEAANSTPGFAFSLSYAGFLNEKWALAGDLAGSFIGTVSDDRLFIAPLALRFIRAFPIGQFVIMPTAGAGMAISAVGDYKHVDFLFKAGSSFLWKASPDMSYGLNVFGNVIPQIMSDYPENSRVGFFLETTLSVSYHL